MNKNYIVRAFKGDLEAEISLPGSKSITNRALLLSALSGGTTLLANFLFSDDTAYMTGALRRAGIEIETDGVNGNCKVKGGKLPTGNLEVFLGNAGTAMRFLTSYFALGDGEFILDGDARMRQRPIGDLVSALDEAGCNIKTELESGFPPVRIFAKGIPGGECTVRGYNSSQYISSLLMAGPYSGNGLTIKTAGNVASAPYIDMTVRMMEQFGIKIGRKGYSELRTGKGTYKSPGVYAIEPDASSASYFLAAAAILGGEVVIKGLDGRSIQGDAGFALVLEKMGCNVEYMPGCIRLRAGEHLRGVSADMNGMPDMAPTLAVTALFADSPSRIRNVSNLRIKESDRIRALCLELKKLGAGVIEHEDGLEIFPERNYRKAVVETYNDHRIAMSFSIAGLKIDGLEIVNPACVTKTFPDFFRFFGRIFNNSPEF